MKHLLRSEFKLYDVWLLKLALMQGMGSDL